MNMDFRATAYLLLAICLGCGGDADLQLQLRRSEERISKLTQELDELRNASPPGLNPENASKLLNGTWRLLATVDSDSIRGYDLSRQELVILNNKWAWVVNGEVLDGEIDEAIYDFSTKPVSVTRKKSGKFSTSISRGILKVDSEHLILTATPLVSGPGVSPVPDPLPTSFSPEETDNTEYFLRLVDRSTEPISQTLE